MKNCLRICTSVVWLGVFGCGRGSNSSKTSDVGLVDLAKGKISVLFSEQGDVILRNCKGDLGETVSRKCKKASDDQKREIDDYLHWVDPNHSPWKVSDEGLQACRRELEKARERGADQKIIDALTRNEAALQKLLILKADLGEGNEAKVFYDGEKYYAELLRPFSAGFVAGESFFSVPLKAEFKRATAGFVSSDRYIERIATHKLCREYFGPEWKHAASLIIARFPDAENAIDPRIENAAGSVILAQLPGADSETMYRNTTSITYRGEEHDAQYNFCISQGKPTTCLNMGAKPDDIYCAKNL